MDKDTNLTPITESPSGALPDAIFDHVDTQPYAVLEPEIHERGILEGRQILASAVKEAMLEMGLLPEPVLSRASELADGHHVKCVRVASLAEAGAENLERPGLIGHCQQTGKKVAIFSGDRWSKQGGAPSDPTARMIFGMDRLCAGHSHLLLRAP